MFPKLIEVLSKVVALGVTFEVVKVCFNLIADVEWKSTVLTSKSNKSFLTVTEGLKCDAAESSWCLTAQMKTDIAEFLSDESIIHRSGDCEAYFHNFPVLENLQPQSDQKRQNFPLAFSHLVHHEIGILEAFLAVFFRTTDLHCIYLDKKAGEKTKAALNGLLNCYQKKFFHSEKEGLDRLFIHEGSEAIHWGHSSILKADLECLKQLLIKDKTTGWKYFLNLAGSELPLKSEEWTRKMLMSFRGEENIIEANELPNYNLYRMDNPWYLKW